VLILKGLKVFCFDTLLQVFILKGTWVGQICILRLRCSGCLDSRRESKSRIGIHHPGIPYKDLRHRESSSTPAESPKTGSGYPPHPRVFRKKSCKLMKTKESEPEKRAKRNLRGGKSLRERNLRQEHRNSAGELAVAAKTRWVAEERRGETGTLSA